ncbi:UNVERIFIED_CONTAM: hypothetical protein RF648_20985, partial [Kocuria sp. CPCC 205274]
AVGQTLTATTGGAGGGASMQMISNLANGKDINEGVGEAALQGAIGGLGAHAVTPAARALARAPKTLRDIQGAGAADFARRSSPLAEQAAKDSAAFQAQQAAPEGPTVQAGEAAIPVEGAVPPEAGAIPVSEPKAAPQPGVVENESGLFVTGTDGQLYPGTRTVGGKVVPVDPNAPFNYEVGDGSSGPAGLGFGPGAPSPAP